jgi:RNA polymerase sigma-70 factor (ECF subfamily)
VVRLYAPTLARQARRILPRPLDPQDAVAEVWLKAYAAAHRFDDSRPILPWLARICANVCLKERRGRLNFLRRLALRPPTRPTEAFDGERLEDSAREALREALLSLHGREREAVTLRFLFELSIEEIAELFGVRPNSVHKALSRGLMHLRGLPASERLREWMLHLGKEEPS